MSKKVRHINSLSVVIGTSFFLSIVMLVVGLGYGIYIHHFAAVSAQVGDDLIPPTTPTNLVVKGNLASSREGGSRDDLTWVASTDDRGLVTYLVYQIVSPNVYDSKPLAEVTTTTYSRQFPVDGYATDYSYYVVAKDGSGNLSSRSNIAHMTGIWGNIMDESNSRYVRGARIDVIDASGSVKVYYANYVGSYLINTPPGIYVAKFSSSGYATQTFSLTVTENALTTRNVFLQKSRK